MRSTLSKIALASTALAAFAIAALPAAADSVTVKVPFNFTVNGKVCPAGTYSVQRDPAANIVSLQSRDASTRFSWVAGLYSETNDSRVSLRFDQHGDDHTLRSVQYGPVVTSRLDKKWRETEDISTPRMPGQ